MKLYCLLIALLYHAFAASDAYGCQTSIVDSSVGNSFVTQGFGSDGNWKWSNLDGQQIFFDGIMGGLTGQLGSSLGGAISPYVSKFTSGIGGQAVQQGLTQGVTGSATGFVMGTGVSLMNGADLDEALKAGGQGALWGAAIGTATGMRSAYKAGENPWTGKPNAIRQNTSWNYGDHKSQTKWENQMKQRGWTEQQIDEALTSGKSYPATNNINPNNGATRYVHPNTGRSIVIDNVTKNLMHVGGDGFNY